MQLLRESMATGQDKDTHPRDNRKCQPHQTQPLKPTHDASGSDHGGGRCQPLPQPLTGRLSPYMEAPSLTVTAPPFHSIPFQLMDSLHLPHQPSPLPPRIYPASPFSRAPRPPLERLIKPPAPEPRDPPSAYPGSEFSPPPPPRRARSVPRAPPPSGCETMTERGRRKSCLG